MAAVDLKSVGAIFSILLNDQAGAVEKRKLRIKIYGRLPAKQRH
jgi:hypothetical protein